MELNLHRRARCPNALLRPSTTRSDLCESAFRRSLSYHDVAGAIRWIRVRPSMGAAHAVARAHRGGVDRQTRPTSIDRCSIAERVARIGPHAAKAFWSYTIRAATGGARVDEHGDVSSAIAARRPPRSDEGH